MRTFKICADSIIANVIEPYNTDVFIHTYKDSGSSHKTEDSKVENITITREILENTYPNLVDCEIEEKTDTAYDEMYGIKVPDKLKKAEPNHYKGTLPNSHSMKVTNRLRKKSSTDYDYIIKLRPDMIIGKRVPRYLFKNNNILWTSLHQIDPSFQISDKFVVGDANVMNYYLSVWDYLEDYWQNPTKVDNGTANLVGERLMKYHMDNSIYECKFFNIRNSFIVRTDLTKF